MIYDVIIVGGGPAGTTCARKLAEKGVKVLLLEKERVPRYKPCGGAIPEKVIQQLTFDLSPIIEARINKVHYTFNLSDAVEINLVNPAVSLVMRDRFDRRLWEQAEKKGAYLIDQVKVDRLERVDNRIAVGSGGHIWVGHYLVGADGVNGTVSHFAELRKAKKLRASLTVELPYNTSADDACAHFGFGLVRKGYAWNFPKKSGSTLGISAMGLTSELLKGTLERWLNFFGVKPGQAKAIAYPLPLWEQPERLDAPNVLLVGDAAGLVDPLSGEGIRHAIRSGEIAAEVILANKNPLDLSVFSPKIDAEVSYEFKSAAMLAKMFHILPKLCYDLAVKNPKTTYIFSDALAGRVSYKDIFNRANNLIQGRLKI